MKKLIFSVGGVIVLTSVVFFVVFTLFGGWSIQETKMILVEVVLAGLLTGCIVLMISLFLLLSAYSFGFSDKIKTIANWTLFPALPIIVTTIITGFALTPLSRDPLFFLSVPIFIIIAVVASAYLTSQELINVSKKWIALSYLAESLIVFGIIFGFGKLIT